MRAPGHALLILLLAASTATSAQAQQTFIYPNRGQSTEQENQDKFECSQWATQQTGFNPMNEQAGSSAPVGEPPMGPFRRREWEEQRAEEQQQQQQQAAAERGNYNRAYGLCLQGRGYSVSQ